MTSDNYTGSIDFTFKAVSDEEGHGEMPVQAGILNPFGTVHAGAMTWFADVIATRLALQGAEITAGGAGFPLAINLNAQLMSNVTSGTLHARAKFVKRGRTMQIVRTEVLSDAGKVLMELTSTHMTSR